MRSQAWFIDTILLRCENILKPKDHTTVRIEYEGAFDHGLKKGGHRGLIIKDDKGRKPSVSFLLATYMRLYWPEEVALDGSWSDPKLEKVD